MPWWIQASVFVHSQMEHSSTVLLGNGFLGNLLFLFFDLRRLVVGENFLAFIRDRRHDFTDGRIHRQ